MFGLSYLKVDPTTYVLHFAAGRVRREGKGLAFFYFRPSASIVAVPTASVDVPFIFNEMTADFQPVSLQGQITYRVVDPKRVSALLNFTFEPRTRSYLSDDPQKLGQRIVNLIQVLTRPEVQRLTLTGALTSSEAITQAVVRAVQSSEAFKALGVEVLAFSLLAVRPTPETAKAMEAPAREELQKKADEAISARRNAAVEQERRIRENELQTEMTVQERRQEIEKAALQAEIEQEKERESLVLARVGNAQKEADVQAYALAALLAPLASLDPKALQVLALGRTDPRQMIALAMKELAQDAGKIGQLNITPDLLTSLLRDQPAGS